MYNNQRHFSGCIDFPVRYFLTRFSILYLNANSLINKIDELRYTSFDNKPDIICVCETWSNDDTLNASLNIDEYNIICRKDRTDTQKDIGGGLLIYAKANLICKELTGKYLDNFNQFCAIHVKTNSNSYLNI